jgi:hypothetical protein
MRGDGRIAVMREFAGDLGDPFIPAGQVMDDDHAAELARAGRARVIGIAPIVLEALERHHLGQLPFIRHAVLVNPLSPLCPRLDNILRH